MLHLCSWLSPPFLPSPLHSPPVSQGRDHLVPHLRFLFPVCLLSSYPFFFTLRRSVPPPLPASPAASLLLGLFLSNPLFHTIPRAPHSTREKGTRERAELLGPAGAHGAGRAHPTPPARGKKGEPMHRRPSRREEPRAARASQAIRAKPGSGAITRPEDAPPLPLENCPGLGSQEGPRIWPEQNL